MPQLGLAAKANFRYNMVSYVLIPFGYIRIVQPNVIKIGAAILLREQKYTYTYRGRCHQQ